MERSRARLRGEHLTLAALPAVGNYMLRPMEIREIISSPLPAELPPPQAPASPD